MIWRYLVVGCVILASMIPPFPVRAATEIKVALVTPEGSTWTNILYQMAEEVERKTKGEVIFKIYAGGISGDELDVLRKMRVNRIHAAGFSGVGLGVVLPEIRILEAPLMFQNYAEVDYVKEKLSDRFTAGFEKKGFVLLGFAEAGFVYFFSKSPMDSIDGVRAAKMWAWKGDPVAETFLKSFDIKTYPLHLTDVNTGLETGMIDSFYAPPLAAVAFQWYAKVNTMLDHPMVNSTGALLMKDSIFNKLSPADQNILREAGAKYCRELIRLSRRDNEEARVVLAEEQIGFTRPSADLTVFFKQRAQEAYQKNIPKLYSRELFDQVQTLIKEHRSR
ncbi:hypothetical protein D3OALGA1CA_224 [Olavius algarvensis associated proteobacterium Delta 3]|nr:hypothetical protein D3OALGA1CA_224 [Olavius algarvensis associated proteobacterium Delta 3]CAB5102238.1 hypothetical protein D3OALGB2SA_1907 [Olavius algarvensis associated proteobacterium Delta 3]